MLQVDCQRFYDRSGPPKFTYHRFCIWDPLETASSSPGVGQDPNEPDTQNQVGWTILDMMRLVGACTKPRICQIFVSKSLSMSSCRSSGSRASLYLKITEHTALMFKLQGIDVCTNILSDRSSVVPNSGQFDYRKKRAKSGIRLLIHIPGMSTRNYRYLEAQTELGGKLVIFCYETHAATRLQAVLEP